MNSHTDPRPNIIVFLTDDHGQWASGCYGIRELRTPSLDYIAATGARMTRAFTPCPVCSPARSSFFTGRFPSQHGVHDYLSYREVETPHLGIAGQTTIFQLLHDAGYNTALFGKWHCSDESTPPPGCDRWFAYDLKHRYAHLGQATFVDGNATATRSGYQAPLLTEEVLRFLRERDNQQPFFTVVGYGATHSPFTRHPERLVESYRNCTFDDITTSPRPTAYPHTVWPPPQGQERREYLAQYYAAVTLIDEQVGRIVDELEARGEAENTLIIYTSDHGLMCGQHNLWLKGNSTTPQNFLDESILVPCLLRWPQRIAAGQVLSTPVDHCDLFATILNAAEVTPDENTQQTINSPGQSYLRLLDGRTNSQDWRTAQVCEYGNARMIRTDTAKLIRRYPVPGHILEDEYYDLADDPQEIHNLIQQPEAQPAIEKLSAKLEDFFLKYSMPGREGINVMQQPRFNSDEPWRRVLPVP